jgi:hypothetical protein
MAILLFYINLRFIFEQNRSNLVASHQNIVSWIFDKSPENWAKSIAVRHRVDFREQKENGHAYLTA